MDCCRCGCVWFCVCRIVSTTTHKNQKCYLSALGQFKDQEEGLFLVSCKLSLARSCLQWLGLQSVADIKVVKSSPQGVTTVIIGEVYM